MSVSRESSLALLLLVTNIEGVDRWQRTHEALRQAGLTLFAEHGFDGIGTARIAEHAGVSEMTLFRHFPTKEALLLDDPFDPRIAEAVRIRPRSEPPMQAVTEGIRHAWNSVGTPDVEALRTRLRIIAEAAALKGAIERRSAETVEAIVDALVQREANIASARVAAAAVIAGLSAALLGWAGDDRADLDAAVNDALNVLGGR